MWKLFCVNGHQLSSAFKGVLFSYLFIHYATEAAHITLSIVIILLCTSCKYNLKFMCIIVAFSTRWMQPCQMPVILPWWRWHILSSFCWRSVSSALCNFWVISYEICKINEMQISVDFQVSTFLTADKYITRALCCVANMWFSKCLYRIFYIDWSQSV